MIDPLLPKTGSLSAANALAHERAELREAAQAFEAIMLRQWLASARAGSLAEDTPLTGGGRAQFETMRDEHFAEIASKNGSLGFAEAIETQLARHLKTQGGA